MDEPVRKSMIPWKSRFFGVFSKLAIILCLVMVGRFAIVSAIERRMKEDDDRWWIWLWLMNEWGFVKMKKICSKKDNIQKITVNKLFYRYFWNLSSPYLSKGCYPYFWPLEQYPDTSVRLWKHQAVLSSVNKAVLWQSTFPSKYLLTLTVWPKYLLKVNPRHLILSIFTPQSYQSK